MMSLLASRVYADLNVCKKGGLKIENEDKDWDFGTGAGFYVDATESPWSDGYNMYTYITQELPNIVFKNFKQIDGERVSITGHSMGGHGALTLVSPRNSLEHMNVTIGQMLKNSRLHHHSTKSGEKKIG